MLALTVQLRTQVNVSEFKATCLRLLEQVRQTGEPLEILKNGVPLAVVYPPPSAERSSPSGRSRIPSTDRWGIWSSRSTFPGKPSASESPWAMKVLLDTHIWLWYLLGDERLPAEHRRTIEDRQVELWLSAISLWRRICSLSAAACPSPSRRTSGSPPPSARCPCAKRPSPTPSLCAHAGRPAARRPRRPLHRRHGSRNEGAIAHLRHPSAGLRGPGLNLTSPRSSTDPRPPKAPVQRPPQRQRQSSRPLHHRRPPGPATPHLRWGERSSCSISQLALPPLPSLTLTAG